MGAKVEAVYAAMRVLYERGAADSAELALISGKPPRVVTARAEREGWIAPAGGTSSDRERLERTRSKLIGELERLVLRRRRRTQDERERIDLLSVATRTLAKVAETLPSRESAKEDPTKRDAEIAAVLGRINERIVELARHYALELARQPAAELGAAQHRPAPGAADPG